MQKPFSQPFTAAAATTLVLGASPMRAAQKPTQQGQQPSTNTPPPQYPPAEVWDRLGDLDWAIAAARLDERLRAQGGMQ